MDNIWKKLKKRASLPIIFVNLGGNGHPEAAFGEAQTSTFRLLHILR